MKLSGIRCISLLHKWPNQNPARFAEGRLWFDQWGSQPSEQCVWCSPPGDCSLPPTARSSQLHHGGVWRGKQIHVNLLKEKITKYSIQATSFSLYFIFTCWHILYFLGHVFPTTCCSDEWTCFGHRQSKHNYRICKSIILRSNSEEIHTSSSDSLLFVYLYFISVILSLLGPPCPLLFCQQSSVQCTAVDIQDTVLSLTLPRRGSSRGGFNRCK